MTTPVVEHRRRRGSGRAGSRGSSARRAGTRRRRAARARRGSWAAARTRARPVRAASSSRDDPARGSVGPGPRARGEPVPQPADDLGESHGDPLGQEAGDPRQAAQAEDADAAGPACPRRGWPRSRRRPGHDGATRRSRSAAARPGGMRRRRRPSAGRRAGDGARADGPAVVARARSPASIRGARAASSAASSSVGGHIGLKLYHCSGAAPIVASSASAISWVARAMSASDERRRR